MTTTYLKKTSLAILLMCTLATGSMAQEIEDVTAPCQSTWKEYGNIRESNSLVRSNDNYRVIHTEFTEPTTGMTLHTFVIRDFYTNNEAYFTTYFNATDSAEHHIHISDMEFYNGECYFCGTSSTNYLIAPGQYLKVGIVGHFSPQSLLLWGSDIYYWEVPKTRELTHLAITGAQDILALVCAIGEMDDDDNTACLVEISKPAALPWKADLGYTDIEKVIFSDILATQDSLTLLAQYQCKNNFEHSHPEYDIFHQVFLVDRASRRGFLTDYTTAYPHYTAHYFLPTEENYNFHISKCPMLLYASNYYADQFGVAFGTKETGSSNSGMRLFHFTHKMMYDKSFYYRTGFNAKIIDIGSIFGELDRPFVLSFDNSHINNVISISNWYGGGNSVYTFQSPNHLSSICQERSLNAVNITSHNSSNYLDLFHQDVDSLHLSTCLTRHSIQGVSLPEKRGAMLVSKWLYSYKDYDVIWNTAEIIEIDTVKVSTKCTKCYGNY